MGAVSQLASNVRWAVTRRAVGVGHLAGYARMAAIRARYPSIRFEGPVFIGPNVRFEVREGFGRMIIGAWCHFGEGARIRCHDGTLRIGAKSVLAAGVTVNTWLDIEIGSACLVGDGVYVCDFDHKTDDLGVLIKDQGIVKSPVRIGDDVWLGAKATVTRGSRIGTGSVVGANTVVRGEFPPYAVLAGFPAQVVRLRDPMAEWRRREAAGLAPRVRLGVRAIILDSAGRVLLRLAEDATPPPSRAWVCPGGGRDADEPAEVALRRLVLDQTGLRVVPAATPVWASQRIAPARRWDAQRDSYHLAVVEPGPVVGAPWSARAGRPRWWSPTELAGQADPVDPAGLVEVLATVAGQSRPGG